MVTRWSSCRAVSGFQCQTAVRLERLGSMSRRVQVSRCLASPSSSVRASVRSTSSQSSFAESRTRTPGRLDEQRGLRLNRVDRPGADEGWHFWVLVEPLETEERVDPEPNTAAAQDPAERPSGGRASWKTFSPKSIAHHDSGTAMTRHRRSTQSRRRAWPTDRPERPGSIVSAVQNSRRARPPAHARGRGSRRPGRSTLRGR